jgi:integrase
MRYRDASGTIRKESTGETDRQQAERALRSRLDERDDGRLPIVLASKSLTFNEWVDWFLDKRSKPPFRAEKTHLENLNALKFLRPAFGHLRLSEITPEAIEQYVEQRLSSGRRIHTKLGVVYRGTLKPATVHQEFRILRRILNVAVKKKRLSANPCSGVEFPVPAGKQTRKPHYMTASEQERIELCAPGYLRHAVCIISEMGLRPYKELMPMRKSQVDFENRLVHIPDSKTPNGEGDMPIDRRCVGGISSAARRDVRLGVSLSHADADRNQALHHDLEEGLEGDLAESRCAILSTLRAAPHVRDPSQRWRSGRSFRDTDATSGRRWRLQEVQPCKAEHDARST